MRRASRAVSRFLTGSCSRTFGVGPPVGGDAGCVVGTAPFIVGATAAGQSERPGNEGEDEQHSGDAERPCEAPAGAHFTGELLVDSLGVPLRAVASGVDERCDQRRDRRLAAGPLDRGLQPSATVDRVVGAAPVVPDAGRNPEVAFQDEVGSGRLEPAGEERPSAEDDFVDDLDGVLTAHDEAGVDERVDGVRLRGRQLVETDTSPGPHPFVGDVGQAEQYPTNVVGTHRGERLCAEALYRSADAAHLDVAAGAQHPAVTTLPDLRHRNRDERKDSVVAAHVVGDKVDQARLDRHTGAPRRLDDNSAQLLLARRPDQQLGVLHRFRKHGHGGQHRILVGANDEHDMDVEGRIAGQGDHPGRPRRDVGRRRGEHLLELIDDQQMRPDLVEILEGIDRRDRVTSGHDDVGPPRHVAGEPPTAGERHEPGPHDR